MAGLYTRNPSLGCCVVVERCIGCAPFTSSRPAACRDQPPCGPNDWYFWPLWNAQIYSNSQFLKLPGQDQSFKDENSGLKLACIDFSRFDGTSSIVDTCIHSRVHSKADTMNIHQCNMEGIKMTDVDIKKCVIFHSYIIWIRIYKQQNSQTFRSQLPFLDISETPPELRYNAAIVALETAPFRWQRALALWSDQCAAEISVTNAVATALKGAPADRNGNIPSVAFPYLPSGLVKGWTFSFREAKKLLRFVPCRFESATPPQHTLSCRICPIKEDTKKLRNTSFCFLIVHSIYIYWCELLPHAIRSAKQSYIFLHS